MGLRAGDVLCTVNGDYVTVEWIEHEILEKPVKVYNLSVADNHTYFVGENGVGVHNDKCLENNWTRMTAKESKAAAEKLGYEPYKGARAKNGEPIYYNRKTKTYISQDIGSGNGMGPHNGGVWKMAKTPEALNSKSTRLGTYDANLNRIGD